MQLSDAHLEIRAQARRFADEVIRPVAAELDRTERFPAEIYARMAELGLFGITVPEADGGAGADALAYALAMEQLARGHVSIADQCGLVELVGTLLAEHGSADQRRGISRRCCARSAAAPTPSPSLTPAPTSRRSAPPRRVRRTAGGSRAQSSGSTTRRCAISRSCWRAPIPRPDGALRFDGALLPEDTPLGPENRGFHVMMSVLDQGGSASPRSRSASSRGRSMPPRTTPGPGASSVGALAEFQGVRWLLADMAKGTAAARLLTHAAAARLDAGERATMEAAMAKCFAIDAAVRHTSEAVQIFGGAGYIRGFEVERPYRDAKITQIYEGTNQIQRNITRAMCSADED